MCISTYITPPGAAKLLHVKSTTLAVWRCTKRYPLPYVKVGRKVLYKLSDIKEFMENNTIYPKEEPEDE